MMLGSLAQIVAFGIFALIAVAGALGMATTMSMFRSGIFLMASFIGVAGLFLLLSADLLSLLQVMMYIGGMLVMIVFMVLFSHDPGGAMMAGMMELPLIERFFSLGLTSGQAEQGREEPSHGAHDQHGAHDDPTGSGQHDDASHGVQKEHDHGQDGTSHARGAAQGMAPGHDNGEEGEGQHGHQGMDMRDMSMTTPIRRLAAGLAIAIGTFLVALLIWRPAWPVADSAPAPHAAHEVGSLLMGKYMIAFEGAGLLILIGIFGAVLLSRPGDYPDSRERQARVAIDAAPAPVAADPLEPAVRAEPRKALESLSVTDVHTDDDEQGATP
jgi:NADH-quinone oxidoreductase subunit J